MSLNSLRQLPPKLLAKHCAQLRTQIIHDVEQVGGHLGGSLGVVELTVALHYVFDTPSDKLVWDVGHQAYAHKLLTGRDLSRIRQHDGISGFPKREESEFDAFGTGHSSTSISAALGMAIAEKQLNPTSTKQHIAVIGDGALTAGMAYEALHHGAVADANLLIIINDNGMSISPNVGGIPTMLASQARVFFESLGLPYSGIIDGHDLDALLGELTTQKSQTDVRVLHIKTEKGRGYDIAKTDRTCAHAIKSVHAKPSQDKTYSELLGDWLCERAQKDKKLHVVTPAMVEGSGLVSFAEQFPEQLTDVGIAEQHAITLGAGMACSGAKPVVTIYSTFLQRGYDQLIHDVALQNLDVTLVIDRAGIVGEDGSTHTGAFDIAFSRCIPNLTIATPADRDDFLACLSQCYAHPTPTLVRYPKGKATSLNFPVAEFGKACIIRQGKSLAILGFGTLIEQILPVAEKLDATLVNMRYIKPLDQDMLNSLASSHTHLVTIEEGSVMGGIGEHIACLFALPTLTLGITDTFSPHGTRDEALNDFGLTSERFFVRVSNWLNSTD